MPPSPPLLPLLYICPLCLPLTPTKPPFPLILMFLLPPPELPPFPQIPMHVLFTSPWLRIYLDLPFPLIPMFSMGKSERKERSLFISPTQLRPADTISRTIIETCFKTLSVCPAKDQKINKCNKSKEMQLRSQGPRHLVKREDPGNEVERSQKRQKRPGY